MNDPVATPLPDDSSSLRRVSNPVLVYAKPGSLSLDSVIIGIVTILSYEFAAVCEVLGCVQEEVVSGNAGPRVYRLGTVWQPSGKSGINVAVTQLVIAGITDSAVIANNFLYDCPNIREIVVCGIAGAVPNPMKAEDHVRFGDIVVSGIEGVLPYDFGKEVPNGFELRGAAYRPSPSLLQSARTLQSNEERGLRPWEAFMDTGEKALGEEYRRPPADTDVLREPNSRNPSRRPNNRSGLVKKSRGKTASCPPIPHPSDTIRNKNPDRPRVFHGLIASANKVLGARRTRERLRRNHKAKAVEMEAAGVAHAAYRAGIGYFVVRGTVDYCNEYKNNIWHRYAALIAAAYTKALIEATNPRVFAGTAKVLAIAVPVTPNFGAPQAFDELIPAGLVQQFIKEADIVDTNGGAQSAIETEPSTPPLTSGGTGGIPSLTVTGTEPSLERPMLASHEGIVRYTVAARAPFVSIPAAEPLAGVAEATQAVGSKQIPATATAQATLQHVVPVASPLERQLLTSEGERRLSEAKSLLEVWDLDSAIALADPLAEWVHTHEQHLPAALSFQLYTTLARLEGVRAKRKRDSGEAVDTTRARFYLGKARDAATR